MRWRSHPARALIVAVLVMFLMPALAGAQQAPGTPVASPQAPEPAVWERLEGIERALVRTWGDVPEGTPAPGQVPTLRFVTGLVAQFDSETSAANGVEPIRDWMLASLQVNIVGVELEVQEVEVQDLGDSASAVSATGTAGEMPLSISVIVVQQDDRVLAVGGSVMAEQELLPVLQGIATVMLERQPGGDEQRDNVGRFSGGLWELFPPQDDASLDGMRRQGDLPIYQAPES